MSVRYNITLSEKDLEELTSTLAENIIGCVATIKLNPSWPEEKQQRHKDHVEKLINLGTNITKSARPVEDKEGSET